MRLGPDLLALVFLLLLQFASAIAAVGDGTAAIDGQEITPRLRFDDRADENVGGDSSSSSGSSSSALQRSPAPRGIREWIDEYKAKRCRKRKATCSKKKGSKSTAALKGENAKCSDQCADEADTQSGLTWECNQYMGVCEMHRRQKINFGGFFGGSSGDAEKRGEAAAEGWP